MRNQLISRCRVLPEVGLRYQTGFSLIELIIAMALSLLLVLALSGVFLSSSRSMDEMAKNGGLVDNSRFAVQLLESDVQVAGFWNGYIPQFDDLNSSGIPGDVPTAVPNPCLAYASWDLTQRINLLGIPVQSSDTLPSGTGCVSLTGQKAGTDVLVVRHADTCLPGVGNCTADTAGQLYFQTPLCRLEKNTDSTKIVGINNTGFVLSSTASSTNNAYVGMLVRTVSGPGAGQYRLVTAYDGSTKTATVAAWTTLPDLTTVFSFEYLLGTTAYPLTQRDCTTAAEKRRFISNIYFVANQPHPDIAGQVIPTLMRSQFDYASGSLVQTAPVPVIEGVEQFRVEVGIDDTMSRCAPATAVDYTTARSNVSPSTCAVSSTASDNTLPTNRGDGAPDRYKRCTTATPCTAQELANVVTVKLYMLMRSRDTSLGYTDDKTYCLGQANIDGSCPAASQVAAANDAYKRHVFVSTVRLVNVSGRRETP